MHVCVGRELARLGLVVICFYQQLPASVSVVKSKKYQQSTLSSSFQVNVSSSRSLVEISRLLICTKSILVQTSPPPRTHTSTRPAHQYRTATPVVAPFHHPTATYIHRQHSSNTARPATRHTVHGTVRQRVHALNRGTRLQSLPWRLRTPQSAAPSSRHPSILVSAGIVVGPHRESNSTALAHPTHIPTTQPKQQRTRPFDALSARVCVCLCLSVCVCVCLSAGPSLPTKSNPARPSSRAPRAPPAARRRRS